MERHSAGARFRQALVVEQPLQIMGCLNAYCALMARTVGFKVIYLSGAGCANASYGLPDLGITSLTDVLADVRRITSACDLPLLVDIDTGWGGRLNIAHTIKEMILAGAAAVHIEDQVQENKRCGHRPNKQLVSCEAMMERIDSAVSAKTDPDFFVIARTDAVASEGLAEAIVRAQQYVKAGADGIFVEALSTLAEYQQFTSAVSVPVLANLTEFGKTPLFSLEQMREVNIAMTLYPLSVMRAMNHAALTTLQTIREQGTQKPLLDSMQTREALYTFLNYYEDERVVDKEHHE